MRCSSAPQVRDHARRAEEVLEVRAADAEDAVADLDGAELSLGDELADEAVGVGELVGGLSDRKYGARDGLLVVGVVAGLLPRARA